MRRVVPEREQGFVLIGIVWLLLLCTALVAVLTLRARTQAQTATDAGAALQARLDLDAAAQTIAADLVMRGGTSPWAMVPSSGTVELGGRSVAVGVGSEAGKLDLNAADPKMIDTALQGLGYAAQVRERFLARLSAARAADPSLTQGAIAGLIGLLERDPAAPTSCVADLFTSNGADRPAPGRMPQALATALGAAAPERPGPLQPGEAVSLRLRSNGGASATVMMRIVGGAAPVQILAHRAGVGC